MVDAPMKMLVPKYSDGSFEILPFIRCASLAVVCPPPKYWSHFHIMSEAQYAAPSVTQNLRSGWRSNTPPKRRNEIGRADHHATSARYGPMSSPYSSRGASPECTCTTSPLAAAAAHTGSYTGSLYGFRSCHIVGIMIPRMPGVPARRSI